MYQFIGKHLNKFSEAGISRSSTIVLAYMMATQKRGLRDCIRNLRRCRPCICPNAGFYEQLLNFEKELGLNLKK